MLLGNVLGKVVKGIGGFLKGGIQALSGKQSLVASAPGVVINTGSPSANSTTSNSSEPWYKQAWVIPTAIVVGVVLTAISVIASLFRKR